MTVLTQLKKAAAAKAKPSKIYSTLNEYGAWEPTEIIEVPCKSAQVKIKILLARIRDVGYKYGFNFDVPDRGHQMPIREHSEPYEYREDALSEAARTVAVELHKCVDSVRGDKKRAAISKGIEAIQEWIIPAEGEVIDADYQIEETPAKTSLALIDAPKKPLTVAESKKLEKCETIITKNLHGFIEVGSALKTIQEGRLYRDSHATFEQYCFEKFEFGRQHAYRLIEATEVVNELKDLSPIGDTQILPKSESQARALAKIKDPEVRRQTWNDVIESATNDDGETIITAKMIEEKVAEILPPAPKRERADEPKSNGNGKKQAHEVESLKEDLDTIRDTITDIAAAWETKYQRQKICDLLRELAKRLAVK